MPDVFLSYTREDQATAQRFAKAFEAEGLSVWWDVTLRSGEAYDQVTEDALRTAKAVVVLWSKKSVTSRWVRAEATQADRHRTLVPATVEPCERPIMFELTHSADLAHWTGDAADPAWRAFLGDVRRFVEADGAAPEHRAPAPPGVASEAAMPSVAVLPFVTRSGREAEMVAEAVTEDLTAALAASPWMRLVAASAAGLHRPDGRDLREIGRDLGVRYLLEGNVRLAGETLRVTAQLVRAESGAIHWARRFERPLAAFSGLQDQVVAELCSHVTVQVQRAEMDYALQKSGAVTAWEASMRSLAYTGHPTLSRWRTAAAEGRRAIDLNPDYGFGYARLAAIEAQLFQVQGGGDPQLEQRIHENIRRARALDPNNPMVIGACAGALLGLGRPHDALPLAERAAAVDPNVDGVRFVLGQALIRLGRPGEGLAQLDALDQLAPDSLWSHLSSLWRSIAFLRMGLVDEAREAAERSLRVFPSSELQIQTILCLARLDAWGPAADLVRRLQESDPDISTARVEHLVHSFYDGSADLAGQLAIARRLWDGTAGARLRP